MNGNHQYFYFRVNLFYFNDAIYSAHARKVQIHEHYIRSIC